MALAECINKREDVGCEVKHQLEFCVISMRNQCNHLDCVNHNLYDSSANGNSHQPCEYYLSFEEALWSGWETGEKVIGYNTKNFPVIDSPINFIPNS